MNKTGTGEQKGTCVVETLKFSVTVNGAIGGVMGMSDFMKQKGKLTLQDQKLIVRQAIDLLQDIYVHLPLKRAMHAVDPVQRLRLLEYRLTGRPQNGRHAKGAEAPMDERRFHNEMSAIFMSLRDLHTVYTPPEPFKSHVALLPFMLEEYFEDQDADQCKYVVRLPDGLGTATFKSGVIAKYWNGIPIERAVELNAERSGGGNPDARHARGLETMTTRPMMTSPPPDEEWVTLGYETEDGKPHQIRIDWIVFRQAPPEPHKQERISGEHNGALSSGIGMDLQGEMLRRTKVALMSPDLALREQAIQSTKESRVDYADSAGRKINLSEESIYPDLLKFTSKGNKEFGYLRIFSFMPPKGVPVKKFVNEVQRILSLLPQQGLILDIRSNPGGVIMAGERLLQLFTDGPITAEPFYFLNTPLTLQLASHFTDTQDWTTSIAQAVQTGAAFSQGFPIESAKETNSIGRKYHGPVLLITDARCYSTADIFAAGFQDHQIGPILGTSGNTGAGGANVWALADLKEALPEKFPALPHGVDMCFAARRTTRVNKMAGVPVEDLGVIPDFRWKLTKQDIMNDNVDLIARAVTILREMTKKKKPARLTNKITAFPKARTMHAGK